MTSFFRKNGFSVLYYDPLGGSHIGNLEDELSGYSHEISAVGGFMTAQLILLMSRDSSYEWFERGLGRKIRVMSNNKTVFEGFVNTVTFTLGGTSEVIGPLTDIGNRVSAIYSPVDFAPYPPVVGNPTTTLIVQDQDSQDLYGIWEKVLSMGRATDDAAEKSRDVYMQEMKYPTRSGDVNVSPGAQSGAQITLDILGHIYWLQAYVYDDPTEGLTQLSTKMKDVLTADPNNVFSGNYDYISTQNSLVPVSDLRFAWDVIMEMLTLGNDSNDYRRTFGFYEDQIAYYETITTDIDYEYRVSDPSQRVTFQNVVIPPWEVRPGGWIMVPDFSQLIYTPLSSVYPSEDPRVRFMETVRYDAPATLSVGSGKTDKLSQLLAKITYSGGFY